MATIEQDVDVRTAQENVSLRRMPRLNVAYIMSRFPKLSETFVLYEMAALQQHGVAVEVFPLMNERAEVMHAEAAAFVESAHYMPLISWRIVHAQAHFLRHQPKHYLKLWADVIRGTWGSANFMLGALAFLPKAVRFAYEMRALGVTHIHAHFANHPTLVALVIHRLLGTPFSFTAHAHDLYVDRHMLAEKVRAAAFVVAISDYNRALIVQECGEDVRHKVVVVHCGVDTRLFRPRQRLAKSGPFTIVCVGSLEDKKGQTYLVEACRLLQEQGVDFVCHLVGEGKNRAALDQQIQAARLEQRVRLAGGQPRAAVAQLLSTADVVALPSIITPSGKMEGIPVALMEALACQVPVVSTNISGIPELVEHEVTGLLVPPADARALADALRRLAYDSALGQAMGRAGREKVLRGFDLTDNAAKLVALMVGDAA